MKTTQLPPSAMAAAKRIAKRNDVPVDKVIEAYMKAAKSKTPLTAASLFLDK